MKRDWQEAVETGDATALRDMLERGADVDATSLDLRDYAITMRVENGDLYEFEASHTGTDWQLACCERPKASDLP